MAKTTNNGSNLAPFLTKCYDMVDDQSTDKIISWSESNDSFVIWDMTDFPRDLLPKYFKHKNFSSFMRQLNIYVSFFSHSFFLVCFPNSLLYSLLFLIIFFVIGWLIMMFNVGFYFNFSFGVYPNLCCLLFYFFVFFVLLLVIEYKNCEWICLTIVFFMRIGMEPRWVQYTRKESS